MILSSVEYMKGAGRVIITLLFLTVHVFAQDRSAQIERARDVIRESADSRDWTERVSAIEAASLIGPNELLRKRLEAFLRDGNIEVRIAALKSLGDLKSSESTPAIKKVLKTDETPEVRFAAAKVLYLLHDPAGTVWLTGVYDGKEKTTSSALKSQYRKFFGNFHSFESASAFIVTSGIGYVPVPGVGEGFTAITGLLADPDLSPRAAALMLLSRDKGTELDALLRQGLKDDDWSVRAAAAQMIAFTGRSTLSQDLVPLFSDKKDKVRLRAAGAYLHLAEFSQQEVRGRAN